MPLVWLINYCERAGTSTLALGYPLFGSFRHVGHTIAYPALTFFAVIHLAMPFTAHQLWRENKHEHVRLLWVILFLVLPVTFGHTTVYRSPALTFSAVIHLAMKRSDSCSVVLRHSSSSWDAIVHWSAVISKAVRSSRRHPVHFFSCPPRSPRPPPFFQTSRTSAVSCRSCVPRIPRTDPPPAHDPLDALTSRLYEHIQIGNRVVGSIVLSPINVARQEAMRLGVACRNDTYAGST